MKCICSNNGILLEFNAPSEENIRLHFRDIAESVVYMRNNRCKYETELILNATSKILQEFYKRLLDAERKQNDRTEN